MTDAVESIGKDVYQKPANELGCSQPHHLLPVTPFDTVILPTEGDGLCIRADQACIRDRDPMGVPTEVGQNRFRPSEGRLGVHHPFDLVERGEPRCEVINTGQTSQVAKEGELCCPVQSEQAFDEETTEQPRQHPQMHEEPRLAGNPLCAVG